MGTIKKQCSNTARTASQAIKNSDKAVAGSTAIWP
jgi:hypothetical protein